jgi:hypothetical protein
MPINVDIQANFSFLKLSRGWKKIVNRYIENFPAESAKLTKAKLEKGRLKPLKPFTREMRKKGRGWSGKKVQPTKSPRPLNQTGTLIKSIKANKKSLEMKAYGVIQEKGFISQVKTRYMKFKYIVVPPRPFIQIPTTNKKFELTLFGGRWKKKFESLSYQRGSLWRKWFWKKIHAALRTKRKLPTGVVGMKAGKLPIFDD